MKIVCDACATKYSIADEKVTGKVFKIRCKKCSNVIVVRGGAPAPAPVVEPVPVPADDAVWHLVIDHEQVGPLTPGDIAERLGAGHIDASTYVWREGFADWLPLADVEELAALTSTTTPVAPPAEAPEPFAAAPELFATSAPPAAMEAAAAPSAQKLRGERNESSVLFSLSDLAKIAEPRRAAPTVAATPTQATPGEGSGLIDIRSMANAYASTGAAAPAKQQVGSMDDLPVFATTGFSEPAVLVPGARTQSNAKLLYAMIGTMAALTLVAIVLLVVLLRDDKPEPQIAKPEVAAVEPKAEPKAESPPPVTQPAPPPVEEQTDKTPAKRPTAKRVDASAPKHGDAPKHVDAPPKRAANPPPALTPKETESCDKITCEVSDYAGACCAKYKPSAAAKSGVDASLPAVLDKPIISAGIGPVRPRAMACGSKSSAKGTVMVKVWVSAAGSVSKVNVESSPDTALGTCVSAAVSAASFQRTQSGGSFRIPFTF